MPGYCTAEEHHAQKAPAPASSDYSEDPEGKDDFELLIKVMFQTAGHMRKWPWQDVKRVLSLRRPEFSVKDPRWKASVRILRSTIRFCSEQSLLRWMNFVIIRNRQMKTPRSNKGIEQSARRQLRRAPSRLYRTGFVSPSPADRFLPVTSKALE